MGQTLFGSPVWIHCDLLKKPQGGRRRHHEGRHRHYWFNNKQRLEQQRTEEKQRREHRRRTIAGSITVERDPTVPQNTLIFPESGKHINIEKRAAEVGNSIFGRQNDALWNGLEILTETAEFPTTFSLQ